MPEPSSENEARLQAMTVRQHLDGLVSNEPPEFEYEDRLWGPLVFTPRQCFAVFVLALVVLFANALLANTVLFRVSLALCVLFFTAALVRSVQFSAERRKKGEAHNAWYRQMAGWEPEIEKLNELATAYAAWTAFEQENGAKLLAYEQWAPGAVSYLALLSGDKEADGSLDDDHD